MSQDTGNSNSKLRVMGQVAGQGREEAVSGDRKRQKQELPETREEEVK